MEGQEAVFLSTGWAGGETGDKAATCQNHFNGEQQSTMAFLIVYQLKQMRATPLTEEQDSILKYCHHIYA